MNLLQLALVAAPMGLMAFGAGCFIALAVSFVRALRPPKRNRYC